MSAGRYAELVEKFASIRSECESLALEMSEERITGDYDDEQAGWLEEVQNKLEELASY